MSLSLINHTQVRESLAQCLPEFLHVNHYWDNKKEVVVAKILPGEYYMTCGNVSVATTLGSCIAACIWDCQAGIGGMNHFMLPLTIKKAHEVDWGQRGQASDATRYGNFAMEHLINTILKNGGRRRNLRAKVFGGGQVLSQKSDVGKRNIDFVLHYLESENLTLESSDLGSIYPRKVMFEPATGKVFVKRLDNLRNNTLVKRETEYGTRINNKAVDGDIELF